MILEPGDMGIVCALEKIELSANYVGRFGLRSKYTRKGLLAATEPQIDPGFRGRLFVGLINLTPKSVTIPFKDDFLSIEFHKLERPSSKPYSGSYQDKMQLDAADIEHILEGKEYALSEVMATLQSLAKSISQLSTDFHMISTELKFLKWGIPLSVALIALFIALQ